MSDDQQQPTPDPTPGFAPPHDHRFGRLFPDGDVGNMLAGVLAHFGIPAERLSELHLDGLGANLTFPVGEPMFILRASEPRALQALEAHYNELAGAASVDPAVTQELVDDVGLAMDRFKAWIVP